MSEKWKLKKESPWIIILPERSAIGEGHQYIACGGAGREGSEKLASKLVAEHEEVEIIRTEITELKAENERLREELDHIIEYWNRDRNDKAMFDALWHIIESAEKALQTEEGVNSNGE